MSEPLGALDKSLREAMQYEIMRLHRRLGVTIVYVTHDQSEALTMSDRVAVFNLGAIQQIAPPSELYEDPENAFVAEFIGENNGLIGHVTSVDGDYATMELSCGATLRGKTGTGVTSGMQALLALRPERVYVGTDHSYTNNSISGTVEDIVYCGDHRRIFLATGNEKSFIIKVPNTQRDLLPDSRQTVTVAWHWDDCKIVPVETSRPS